MCLIVEKDKEILIAEEDIICYKFVEDEFNNGHLSTPFYNCSVVLGETYTSKIHRTYGTLIDQAIHSFVKLKDAKKYLTRFGATAHVVRCIIPKGSRYIYGVFDSHDREESIASDTITYVKILATCKYNNKRRYI